MRYEFKLVGGQEIIEKSYPAAQAPDLGTVIVHEGRKFMRILSTGATVYDASNGSKYPCEDISLPRDTETPAGKGKRGFPAFNSQSEHKEFGKRHGMGWD